MTIDTKKIIADLHQITAELTPKNESYKPKIGDRWKLRNGKIAIICDIDENMITLNTLNTSKSGYRLFYYEKDNGFEETGIGGEFTPEIYIDNQEEALTKLFRR